MLAIRCKGLRPLYRLLLRPQRVQLWPQTVLPSSQIPAVRAKTVCIPHPEKLQKHYQIKLLGQVSVKHRDGLCETTETICKHIKEKKLNKEHIS